MNQMGSQVNPQQVQVSPEEVFLDMQIAAQQFAKNLWAHLSTETTPEELKHKLARTMDQLFTTTFPDCVATQAYLQDVLLCVLEIWKFNYWLRRTEAARIQTLRLIHSELEQLEKVWNVPLVTLISWPRSIYKTLY